MGAFDDLIPEPLEAGNIDLNRRPVVKNADGTISTVRSMSVNFDGREYLIPTVSDDGRVMEDEEAIQTFQRSGKHLGVFGSPEAATAFAERLHNDQAKQYAPQAGMFDDLIPATPQQGDGDRLWDRASAGLAQGVGGTLQGVGESLGGLLTQAFEVPSLIRELATGTPLPNPVADTFNDVGAFGADVADVGRELSKAASQGITRPESLADAWANPGNAARYYGGILAESAPMMLAAMGTRSPTAGAALMGTLTGGQEYQQQRSEGASLPQALEQSIASGLLEAGLGQAPLETALTAGLPAARRIALTTAQEAGTEAVTGGGQEALGAVLAGKDVDSDALKAAVIDSLIVGAPLGAAEGLLGNGPAAPARQAPPVAAATPQQAASIPAEVPSIGQNAANPLLDSTAPDLTAANAAASIADALGIPPESVADLAESLLKVSPELKARGVGADLQAPTSTGIPIDPKTSIPVISAEAGDQAGNGSTARDSFITPKTAGGEISLEIGRDSLPAETSSTPVTHVRSNAAPSFEPAEQTRRFVYGDSAVTYSSDGNTITAHLLSTPKAKRGTGSARAAFTEFLRYADAAGLPVEGAIAEQDSSTDPNKLAQFYQSMGFELTGEMTPEGSPKIVRPPQRVADATALRLADVTASAAAQPLPESLNSRATAAQPEDMNARLPRETLPNQRTAGLPQNRAGEPLGEPQRAPAEAPQGSAAGMPEAQGTRAGDVSRTPASDALRDRNRAVFDRAGDLAQRVLDRRQQQTPGSPQRRSTDAKGSRPAPGQGRFDAFPVGMADTDVTRAVRDVVRDWQGDAPAVNVVQEVADIRDPELRARIEADPAGNTIEGVFDGKGGVYLIASNLRDPQRALEVLAHEAFGHYGVEGVLGRDGWQRVLADAGRLKARRADLNPKMREALDSTLERYPDADPVTFARELLAVMAERGVTGSFMDRVLSLVREFFRKLGFPVERWSDATLRDIVRQGIQRVQRANPSPNMARERGPAYSRRTPQQAAQENAQTRAGIAQAVNQPQGTAGWSYDRGQWEGRAGQLRQLNIDLSDKMAAWKGVQDNIAEQVGASIPDAQNVYRMENLMHGRVDTSLTALENAAIRPLMDAMKKAGVDAEALGEYLMARHAQERNADIARKNPQMPDGGSGMTNSEAQAILASADKAKLEPLARRVDAITKATRARLLQHGLITQEQFDAMEQQYQFFVPLRGKDVPADGFEDNGRGTGRGLDTRSSQVKTAMGRGAGNRASNVLGEVIGDAQRSIIVAEKARVGRAMMRLVLANPNPDLWEVEPVQTERKLDANGEVYEAVVNDANDPSVVMVRVNGKPYRVQINSQPLAQAMNNVGVEQMGAVTRAAGLLNRYFSAILTKYNPAFVPVNATRDALFGMTGLAVEHGEAVALRAALLYPTAAKAAFKYANNMAPTTPMDKLYQRFAQAGGRTGYVNMPSVEEIQKSIDKGRFDKPSAARAVVNQIGAVNDAVENALRFSAFATLTERGMSDEAAAEYAKNLTVNFNRKGQMGAKLNAWFLFYNAALQGAKRTGTLLRRPKTYAYLGALAGAQTLAAMAAMGMEDDDGEPLWDKIPDHVKRRNLVIPWDKETIITIPMPYGFNLFTYLAGRVTGAVLDDEGDPNNKALRITGDMVSAATESFFPVPIGDGPLGFLPTALRIPVNIQTNRDDFGRAIRTEQPFGKFDVPRASMGKPDTMEVFKVTAQGLNRLGGGDEYTPPLPAFDHAPEDIEYLLKELGGGAGKFVIDLATLGEKAAGDAPDITRKDVPILNRFTNKVDQQAAEQAAYYARTDRVNRSLEKVRDVYEREGEVSAQKLLDSLPELEGAAFKTRKRRTENGAVGSVIENGGRPTMEVTDPDSVFGRYKAAEFIIRGRNETRRGAYAQSPTVWPWPTEATKKRDAVMKQADEDREKAQSEFNAAWLRAMSKAMPD